MRVRHECMCRPNVMEERTYIVHRDGGYRFHRHYGSSPLTEVDNQMTLVGQPSNIEFITAPSRPTQMPVEWYDANSEDHFWFQWRTRVTRMLVEKAGIPTEQNLRVLDIGCGTGI